MQHQSLGITATELFACNPYRILGLPVDADSAQVSDTYKKLLAIAGTPEADSYTTAFDFPSLPPFKRDEQTLRTAYAKLASNGYRCFAYSDGVFSAALNIDDVMLNLRDITCYDCFLRCYMWLITNDRKFEEPELWIPLCKHIDKMIMSSPEEWDKYFDHRFPAEMTNGGVNALRSFYTTFCDIILLPIKEMVRGSMKCKTATDILRVAKVDLNESFPYIDIPQANLPKPGEQPPKLKIAVKDGEEYFDANSGKVVNFEAENEAAVESNVFAVAATTISADAIVGDEGPDEEPIPDEPAENPPVPDIPVQESQPVREAVPSEPIKTVPEPTVQTVQSQPSVQPEPAAASKPAAEFDPAPIQPAQVSKPAQPKVPDGQEAPKPPVDEIIIPGKRRKVNIPGKNATAAAQTGTPFTAAAPAQTAFTAPKEQPVQQPVQQAPQQAVQQTVDFTKPAQSADTVYRAPVSQPAAADTSASARKPYKKHQKSLTLTSIIDELDKKTDETTEEILSEEESEENLYTDTLIKMLRANRTGQLMKSADTRKVFDNGDNQGPSGKSEVSMDAINMRRYDKSRLDSPYENAKNLDKMDPKKVMQEKYKNININDMLNPTVGNKMQSSFQPDAIEEYKKNKENQKKANRSIIKLTLTAAIVIAVIILLYIFGGVF